MKKGQLLAEIENMDLRSIAEDATRELARSRELAAAGLLSKAALDTAAKGAEIARSNLERSIIRAPFDGMVAEMNLQIGESSQPATGLNAKAQMRLVDLKPRRIRGDIDEMDLAKVQVGTPVRVKIYAARTAPYGAAITRVVPFVNSAQEHDRTAQIEIELKDNPAPPSGHTQRAKAQTPSPIPVGASAERECNTAGKADALVNAHSPHFGKIYGSSPLSSSTARQLRPRPRSASETMSAPTRRA